MKCNSIRLALLALGIVSLCASARPSMAAPAVFFDRDDNTALMTSFPKSQAEFDKFTATLSSFGMNDVDTAVGFNPTLSFGSTGITATVQGVLAQAAPTFQIGAQALLEADVVGFPQVNTTFDFNTYIKSFGLFVIQGGDQANNNPITFRLKNTSTNSFTDVPVQVGPGWGDNNVFFLGVTDTAPFNQVEIIEAGDFVDGMLYDNIVAGGAVPEPGSLLLVVLGGAGMLMRARGFRRG
ncbi:MAG: PEP-CTERM sorting domain-containing protein [Pirellulales bacterium]